MIPWSKILYYLKLLWVRKWTWTRYDGRQRWRNGRFDKTTPTNHHLKKWHHINSENTLQSRFFLLFLVLFLFCCPSRPNPFWALFNVSEWYHAPKYCTTSNCFGSGSNKNANKGAHDVLEHHVGRPRCFYSMIQHIIIPQIALAQDRRKTPKMETAMFWKPM